MRALFNFIKSVLKIYAEEDRYIAQVVTAGGIYYRLSVNATGEADAYEKMKQIVSEDDLIISLEKVIEG